MSTATLKDQATQDKADILAVIETLKKAHHDKDAAAIAAQYANDAAIFNLAPPLVHRGVDLQEKQAWFDTWDGPVEIESRDIHITVAGDNAFCHGYMQMEGNKKGVEQRVSFWMRETLCLERSRNGWRIVHEHTSVPFYMDGSLHPAFDLKP
ncbi:MAG: nuclear transport factor 2 family protein [Acidobacteriaceae bacterium]